MSLLQSVHCVFPAPVDTDLAHSIVAAGPGPSAGGINLVKLLEVALALPKNAKTPLDVRLLGVRVAHQLFTLLHQSWDDSTTAATARNAAGASHSQPHLYTARIRPYSFYTTGTCSSSTLLPQSLLYQRMCTQYASREGLASLVGLLDDTSDMVRLNVCTALQTAVPLVCQDTRSPVTAVAGAETETGDAGASAETNTNAGTFTFVAHRLVKELVVVLAAAESTGTGSGSGSGSGNDISTALGEVLRVLAILDPAAAHALLAPLPVLALSDLQKSYKEPLNETQEIMTGLLEHCALLKQLQK